MIDNLKAAIVTAAWDDPEVQQAYRECAEHYGFLIAPCRPGTPEHKGKVEQGGVHYVKRNFLAGRQPMPISARQPGRAACGAQQVAGQRIHGTTKQQPLLRFRKVEQAALRPLPDTPYEPSDLEAGQAASRLLRRLRAGLLLGALRPGRPEPLAARRRPHGRVVQRRLPAGRHPRPGDRPPDNA